jgi:hypothetical protein
LGRITIKGGEKGKFIDKGEDGSYGFAVGFVFELIEVCEKEIINGVGQDIFEIFDGGGTIFGVGEKFFESFKTKVAVFDEEVDGKTEDAFEF